MISGQAGEGCAPKNEKTPPMQWFDCADASATCRELFSAVTLTAARTGVAAPEPAARYCCCKLEQTSACAVFASRPALSARNVRIAAGMMEGPSRLSPAP